MSIDAIQVVTDLAGLRALGAEWDELAARFKSPLLRHEWNLACAEAFSDSLRPAVHVLRSGGGIVAIAPLALVHGYPDGRRKSGVRRLEMLGTFGEEPVGFLYRDEQSLKALLRHVLAGHRLISLSRIEGDSIEARLLRELVPRSSVCVTRGAGASYWVRLGPSWRDVEGRMSPGQRSMLRRRRRKAEELGEVRFEAVAADEANVDHYLGELFHVEAASWKTRSGTAILSLPHIERFETLYARRAARLGLLRFYFLRINGEAAAAQLLVDYGGRLWQGKIGYDERFRRVSPGLLLTHEVLQHACERGYDAYEFLGHAEPWEAIWTDQQRHYCSIRVYPMLSPVGGIALARDLAVFAGHRAGRAVWKVYQRGGLGRLATPEGGGGGAGG